MMFKISDEYPIMTSSRVSDHRRSRLNELNRRLNVLPQTNGLNRWWNFPFSANLNVTSGTRFERQQQQPRAQKNFLSAVVVAQLAEWSSPLPEDLGSNLFIGNIIEHCTVINDYLRNKSPGMVHDSLRVFPMSLLQTKSSVFRGMESFFNSPFTNGQFY